MLSRSQTTLLTFLALSSLAQASWFEDSINHLVNRQQDDTPTIRTITDSVIPSVTTPTPTQPTSPTGSTTTTVEPTTVDPPRTSTSETVTTPTRPPSTTTSESSTTSSTTTESSSSTTTSSETTSSRTSSSSTTTSRPVTTPSSTVIQVTRTTIVDGQVVTSVSETTSTIQPTATDPASLNQSNERSGSNMSAKTRDTIIGLVVGLGGAALLGGLAIVAYRIWGRKKHHGQEDDFLNYSRPDTGIEKAGGSSGGNSNPFQSTLENYHNPTKVNASSNF